MSWNGSSFRWRETKEFQSWHCNFPFRKWSFPFVTIDAISNNSLLSISWRRQNFDRGNTTNTNPDPNPNSNQNNSKRTKQIQKENKANRKKNYCFSNPWGLAHQSYALTLRQKLDSELFTLFLLYIYYWNSIDCSWKRFRLLWMAWTVYKREICPGASILVINELWDKTCFMRGNHISCLETCFNNFKI